MMDSKNTGKIKPRCLSERSFFFSGDGYILPCCDLCNNRPGLEDLLTEEMKLENNDSVEDIIDSFEWRIFHYNLIHHPEKAPYICHKICGVKDGSD